MGRRNRQRGEAQRADVDYTRCRRQRADAARVDDAGDAARVRGRAAAGAPLLAEDAWQRAVEFLFERLAVRWVIADVPIEKQKELLQRFRFASKDERAWIRGVLREHLAEWFPDVEAP